MNADAKSNPNLEADGDDLPRLRERIDEIDSEIVRLLNERASVSLRVGKLKAGANNRVYVPDREVVVYSNIFSLNTGPLSDTAIKNIYDQILLESRNLQSRG